MFWIQKSLPRLKQLLVSRLWPMGQPDLVQIWPSPKFRCSHVLSLYSQLNILTLAGCPSYCSGLQVVLNQMHGKAPGFLRSLVHRQSSTVVSAITPSALSNPWYVTFPAIVSAGETLYSPNLLHLKAFLRTSFYQSACGNLLAHISQNGQFSASIFISFVLYHLPQC